VGEGKGKGKGKGRVRAEGEGGGYWFVVEGFRGARVEVRE
jgi:hypothetical protein